MSDDLAPYGAFQRLTFERPREGVLLVTLNRPDRLNATDEVMHRELCDLWPAVDRDRATRAVVVTGQGRAFSAGGDLEMVEKMANDFPTRTRVLAEAHDLVYNIVNCTKPIISAINGVAVGAGLVVALLADIPIAAKSARILDGHIPLGVPAGDHAAMLWPLLCGLAKAKYYLLTGESLTGEEAERLGMVAMCTDDDGLLDTALDLAQRLAAGPRFAIRYTKYALNNWLRLAGPGFDASVAFEYVGFTSPDVAEGVRALREHRAPNFHPQPRDT